MHHTTETEEFLLILTCLYYYTAPRVLVELLAQNKLFSILLEQPINTTLLPLLPDIIYILATCQLKGSHKVLNPL